MQTLDYMAHNPTDILFNIRTILKPDLDRFDEIIQIELASSVPLTREITQHLFNTKGKQLRPLLVMLASHALAQGKPLEKKHYELALVIEFVHTATLLHDDVVDDSQLRRGKKTANAIWGNAASVLVGDFLYSRAFQILARHNNPQILDVLSQTTNAIAEGEVMQLMNQHDADLSEENYFHVITQKTACLFSAASKIGALLQNANQDEQNALSDYGLNLGITFQIIDDLLDYEATATTTGKNVGDDLRDGKATLPLIYALQSASPEKSHFIRAAIQTGDETALPEILNILKETNAFAATRTQAKNRALLAQNALNTIPASIFRNALEDLISFAVNRNY